MELQLTPEQQAFAEQAVKAGRFGSVEDAVRDALRVWEEDERRRADIVAALEESEADLENGDYRDYTSETLPNLADELRTEAHAVQPSTVPVGEYLVFYGIAKAGIQVSLVMHGARDLAKAFRER